MGSEAYMNIRQLLEQQARDYGNKPAVIFQGRSITFAELADTVFRLAGALQRDEKIRLKRGDKVALYLPNGPEYVFSYLALWVCGAVVVPLDFMLTEDELAACCSHADARILIAAGKEPVSFASLKAHAPGIETIIVCHAADSMAMSFERLAAEGNPCPPDIAGGDKDPAIIFYTSGTTGKVKGVLVNYRQLGAPPEAMKHFVDLNSRDITVCAVPFSHLGGLIYIQNMLSFGMTVVLMERFIPHEFLKNVQNYRATCFWIVPSMYYAMLSLKDFEKFDLSTLRWIVTFGASNAPEALRRFHRHCPRAHLLNGWGLTETNAPTTVLPMGSSKIESVGRPAPWVEVKIADDNNATLPAGETGEIVVRGWVVTEGYYKDAELTKEAIKDGWFHTGDLGRFDAEGDLYIVGRTKEMIKVAGQIVFEPEIEAVLYRHQAVAEAAVVGVADTLRGEAPRAFVVAKDGQSLKEEEMRQFCRAHLAHYKIPHSFIFVSALPKNRAGKIDKEELRKGK